MNSVPPEKMPVIPDFRQRCAAFFQPQAQRFDQFGRANIALDVVVGVQNRDRLVDAVFFVFFQMFHPAFFDQLDHPPRIEIDAKTNPSAKLAEVLDRQSQPTWPGRTEHQPIGIFWEIFVGQGRAEHFIIVAKVIDHNRLLGTPVVPPVSNT